MRFGVLGPLAVWADDDTPVPIPGVKVRAVLAHLLAHRGHVVSADRLIDDLWGTEPPNDAVAALQAKVSQLRRALEQAEPGARELVVSRSPGYLLDVPAESVDADRFAALTATARAESDPAKRAQQLTEARQLWRGAAFADFADEDFVRTAVIELAEQRRTAMEDHADARLELGEHDSVIAELSSLTEEFPQAERLASILMRAFYRAGRQAEALETYERLRSRLADDLGVDPGAEIARLHLAILQQDSSLEPPAEASPTNLPEPVDDLIGREAQIDEVRRLLNEKRLVTLTGTGGVGKTQLAFAAARHEVYSFPDGVWLVELGGFDPSFTTDCTGALADSVSAILDIRHDSHPRSGSTAQLTHALRGKKLLLVMDNCEHLIESVALLAEELLRTAPEVRILATSREPLNIQGEQLRAISPLDLPPENVEDPEELADLGAVRLFIDRVRASDPDFTLTAANARSVAWICRSLDGLPLALELAATRARMLGVHDLAVRICDRFQVLTSGGRTAPRRQQTLRGVIDWSWGLLTSDEQAVLRRLSVHAEGATADSAERVCAGDPVRAEDVFELIGQLVDRSLVATTERGDTTRYQLLETVQAYCRERLEEAGEQERTQRAHAEHFTELAERADVELRGQNQREWLRRIDVESANIRGALASAAQHEDAELALRLVHAMSWYWLLRGQLREAHRALSVALSLETAASEPEPQVLYADVLRAGFAHLMGGDTAPLSQNRSLFEEYDDLANPIPLARAQWWNAFVGRSGEPEVEKLLESALRSFREQGDQWGVATTLSTRAEHARISGNLETAVDEAERAAEIFDEIGDRWGQSHTAMVLGNLAEIRGDYRASHELHYSGLQKAEELGLWPMASRQLSRLGRLAMLEQHYELAESYLLRGMRLAEQHADEAAASYARGGLGLLARRQYRFDQADTHFRKTFEWEQSISHRNGIAFSLAELGFVAEQRGDAKRAQKLHLDGLVVAREIGDPRAIALSLEGLAGVLVLEEQYHEAARTLGTAEAARESVGSPLPSAERGDVNRISASVSESLENSVFAEEFERGKQRDLTTYLTELQPITDDAASREIPDARR